MANDPTNDEPVEVRCPECGVLVKIPEAQAARDMEAKCPKGHLIPLAKALG